MRSSTALRNPRSWLEHAGASGNPAAQPQPWRQPSSPGAVDVVFPPGSPHVALQFQKELILLFKCQVGAAVQGAHPSLQVSGWRCVWWRSSIGLDTTMKGHSSLHSLPKADLATCLYPLAMACSVSGDGRHGFWVTLKEAGGRLPYEGLALSRVSRRRGLRHSSG